MNKLNVLDCTLRDGGYCNKWEFGFQNVQDIIKGLVEANIDIIECGFLTNKVEYHENLTKFSDISQISKFIPKNRCDKLFVAMINYGEYDVEELPNYDGTSIDGIRVAFHKKDRIEALKICNKIKDKGYKVFIQPMATLSYTDEEFLELIHNSNSFEPYAFYIVDSFGMMKEKDLIRLFYIVEHNLKENIFIGFHSHNNLQLSFSNSQCLANFQTNRGLIIDSSIYGMGRGAGNLNTELFIDYLNENKDKNYELKPILVLIDKIINKFYLISYWGYSLPNYLSAIHNAHPNYSGYLSDKNTLTFEDINEIFSMMDTEKKLSFDKEYIEKLYLQYMMIGKAHNQHREELKNILYGKKVLLIAPGRSSIEEKDKILEFINNNDDVITMSVNFDYEYLNTDYIFVSNLRRFDDIHKDKYNKCIVTSNIPVLDDMYLRVRYYDLLNNYDSVKDNAGMMVIKFLIINGVRDVFLAGFDGYSHDVLENYSNSKLSLFTKNSVLDAMNDGIKSALNLYAKDINVHFITTRKHF